MSAAGFWTSSAGDFGRAEMVVLDEFEHIGSADRQVEHVSLRISLHQLRHSHATIALRAGVHAKVVSERLGHASVAFTLDTYTDALPDLQETAAALIAELVLGE